MQTSAHFVVIFKAKIKTLEPQYYEVANHLRLKALQQFNCLAFESATDHDFEIALSYWSSLEDIKAWHLDLEHQVAQQFGREKWYRNFSVEICHIQRSYALHDPTL